MTNYHLNHSFKRFPGHYFYVIALVSTGLFWGHTTTVVKASTSEDSTPSTDTASSVDQPAPSTVLRTSATTQPSSTEQNTDGFNNVRVVANSSFSNESTATKIAAVEPVVTTSNTDDPGSTDSSSGTSTASVTLTPPGGTLPGNDGSSAVPDTGQSDDNPIGSQTSAPATDTTTITPDPENTTQVAPDALGVKPVGSIRLNVPIPTDGKDAITATDEYYYTLNGPINITAQLANYHTGLANVSIKPGTWLGSAYAASIPTNAVGTDPKTSNNYIDEWMPDIWFQYLLWLTEYQTQFSTWAGFRNSFSKSDLNTLTNFTITQASQQTTSPTSTGPVATPIFTALQQTQSLEGLQYAQNLNTINFTLNTMLSDYTQSRLWDISSLAKIPNLTNVRFLYTSIQDVSALKANKNLQKIELSFNEISDISGFAITWIGQQTPPDINDNRIGSSRYNSISMPLLVLKPGTTSVEVSYNVKEYDGSLVHMYPSDGSDFSTDYPETQEMYKPSTADAVSEDDQTIVFYNLKTPPAGDVGWLSAGYVFWEDGYPKDPSAFDIWVSIPYIINDEYGATKVNYENLMPNGQQEEVATSTPLSGSIGTAYDISTDRNTTYPLEWLIDKYGSNYIVLDGTGNYSDYLANNGLAKAAPVTGTYSTDPQSLTVLFAPSQLTVQHGYYQSDGQFASLVPDNQVAQSLTANLAINDQATDIQNFHYKGAEIVASDGTVTAIDSATTSLPYLSVDHLLRIVYEPNQMTIPVSYVDNLSHVINPTTIFTGTTIDSVSPTSTTAQLPIANYTFDHYELNDGTPITNTVPLTDLQAGLKLVYTGNTLQIPVNYVDNLGQKLQSAQIQGVVNAPLPADFAANLQINIPNYTFSYIETVNHHPIPANATYDTIHDGINLVYTANSTNVIPPVTPEVTPPEEKPGENAPESVPAKVIYALKQVSLHTSVNFTDDNILMTYVKKPRIYRPRFMVIGTARDSQNRLRYLVRDINSKSDTYGIIGYLTADPESVRSAYYRIVPKTITVINPKGINAYANADLTGKLTHYRQGTVLKVANIIKDRTATRFILTNGQIVTASKVLVKMGTIAQPKTATKLLALNRYGDVNLTTRLEHFKRVTPKSFTILNWDYSNGYDYHVKSLKRYQIGNGYITAYSQLVKSDY